MKLERMKSRLTRVALVMTAIALSGCATTSGQRAREDGNPRASSHGKHHKSSAVMSEDESPKGTVAHDQKGGKKHQKKIPPDERRKLVRQNIKDNQDVQC